MTIPIKFSYNFSKGSCKMRKEKMQKLNSELFDNIFNLYKYCDSVAINKIEKCTKKHLPEPINFKLVSMGKEKYETQGGACLTQYFKGLAEKYFIELPTKNNLLDVNNLSILMHEYTHFLDYLFNPKTIKTGEKVITSGLDPILASLYKNHYYNNKNFSYRKENKIMKQTKNETLKILKNLSNENKITILKSLINLMQTELNAYEQGFNFSVKLLHQGRKYNSSDMIGVEKTFLFDKKIKYVKKLLYKIISEERYNNAKSNSKNNINKLKSAITYYMSCII